MEAGAVGGQARTHQDAQALGIGSSGEAPRIRGLCFSELRSVRCNAGQGSPVVQLEDFNGEVHCLPLPSTMVSDLARKALVRSLSATAGRQESGADWRDLREAQRLS